MTSKTYAELAVATELLGGDLLASFRGVGPLKSVTALLAKAYFQDGSFLTDGSAAMTGAAPMYAGTESLPGVTFSGDTDTGIYRVGANSVGIATGGVNRVTFDVNGVTSTQGFIGNLTGNVTGSITGNAATATKWATARNLSLTGDGTATLSSVDGSAAVSGALTLATINANVGSFGTGSQVATVTVNGKGLVTAASNTAISITDANLSSQVTVSKGGTGQVTLTNHGVLLGQGTSAVAVTAAGTAGQALVSGGAGADPAFGVATVVGGGTGAATFAANGVLYGNGTSALGVVAPSTAGFVLTSNGSGAAPTMQASASAGALVFLSTVPASNSPTVDVETTFNSTYDVYMLVGSAVIPDSGNSQIRVRAKIGGSYDTGANYAFHTMATGSGSTSYNGIASAGLDYITLAAGVGSTTPYALDFVMWIFNPASTSLSKLIDWSGVANNGAVITRANGSGLNTGTSALTGIRFYGSGGGNIASGDFRLYGVKKSA